MTPHTKTGVEPTRSKPPQRLTLHTPTTLANLKLPPRRPILGDWLLERNRCLVYAQTGRGKSLFCMSLAMAVASGGSAFGWTSQEPRKVLYVDAEMDIQDIKERDQLLRGTIQGADGDALNGNLLVLARHDQPDGSTFPDLVDPDGKRVLIELVSTEKPTLVVIDNLSTMADISDENDAAAITPVQDTIIALRNLGCTVILVHHTGKKEGAYRGSSKLAATFETIIQLATNPDLLSGDTGFAVKVDKSRSANPPEPLKVALEVDEDSGSAQWAFGGSRQRELEELVQAVQSREFPFAKDVAAHLGLSPSEVSKRKREAIRLGLIAEAEWTQCLSDAKSTDREFGDFELPPELAGVADVGAGGADTIRRAASWEDTYA